jgi:hypothetical protein
MPTRKRKRGSEKLMKYDWTDEQTAFLLAWNDHCLGQTDGRELFQTTIVDELKKRWQRDFKWKHVYNKLRSIHRTCHNETTPAYRSSGAMFDEGTACLDFDWVEPGVQDALETAKAQLRIESKRRSDAQGIKDSRSTSKTVTIYSRRLRSQDSSVEKSPAQKRGYSGTPIAKSEVKKTSTKPKISNEEGLPRPTPHSPKPAESEGNRSYRGLSHGNAVIQDSPQARGAKFLKTSSSTPKIATEGDEIPDSTSESSLTTISDGALEILRQETKSPLQAEKSSQESELVDLRLKVSRLTAENMKLHNALHDSRKALEDRERCWSRAIAQKGENDQVGKLLKLEKYIVQIRGQLDQATTVNRFLDGKALERYAPTKEQVQSDFESIFLKSRMIFQFEDWPSLRIPKPPERTPKATTLVNQVVRQFEHSGYDGSAQAVARVVTSTAIQEWVFETAWPCFDEPQSRLLRAYRESVATRKGKIPVTPNECLQPS